MLGGVVLGPVVFVKKLLRQRVVSLETSSSPTSRVLSRTSERQFGNVLKSDRQGCELKSLKTLASWLLAKGSDLLVENAPTKEMTSPISLRLFKLLWDRSSLSSLVQELLESVMNHESTSQAHCTKIQQRIQRGITNYHLRSSMHSMSWRDKSSFLISWTCWPANSAILDELHRCMSAAMLETSFMRAVLGWGDFILWGRGRGRLESRMEL